MRERFCLYFQEFAPHEKAENNFPVTPWIFWYRETTTQLLNWVHALIDIRLYSEQFDNLIYHDNTDILYGYMSLLARYN